MFFVLIVQPVFAHEMQNAGHEEDASMGQQFEAILPFHHFGEGHVFAGIMLVLLWASFFYTLYILYLQMFDRKKRK